MEGFPGGSVVKEAALPVQGMGVQFLVREDPTCLAATKLVYRNYWVHTPEPVPYNKSSRSNEKLSRRNSRATPVLCN